MPFTEKEIVKIIKNGWKEPEFNPDLVLEIEERTAIMPENFVIRLDSQKHLWGEGEWQNEPDIKAWIDPKTGMQCLIVRQNSLGTLCGYVGVRPDDAAYSLTTSWSDPEKEYANFNCHGSVTWCGTWKRIGNYDVPADMKFIGFDCAHAGDYLPSNERMSKLIGMSMSVTGDVYRNMAYVEAEVRELAEQIYEFNRQTN